MKKLKIMLLVFILSIVLIACNNFGSEKTVLEFVEDDYYSKVVLETKDGKLLKQTNEKENSYSLFNIDNQEQAKEILKDIDNDLIDLKGVTHKVTLGEKGIEETIVIDYNEANFEEIKSISGLITDEDSEDIEVKKIISKLEDQGYEIIK